MDEALSILGVPRGATLEEIHAAYLQRAKSAHPDVGGSQPEFVRLQAAYEELIRRFRTHDATTSQAGCAEAQQPECPAARYPSYEDLMSAARERLNREAAEYAASRQQHWQSPTQLWELAGECWWSIVLTLSAAAVMTTNLCTGNILWGSWCSVFTICLLVLSLLGALAGLMEDAAVNSGLPTYNKFIAAILIAAGMPLVTSLGGPTFLWQGQSLPVVNRERAQLSDE